MVFAPVDCSGSLNTPSHENSTGKRTTIVMILTISIQEWFYAKNVFLFPKVNIITINVKFLMKKLTSFKKC
jgi:hypothetical protein